MNDIHKKRIAFLLAILSALSFLTFLFLTSIDLVTFDRDFFQQEYQKLNTADYIGISEEDLLYTTEELLAYLEEERNNLDIRAEINGMERPVFNQREITHMVDVKRLFIAGERLRRGSLVTAVVLLMAVYWLVRRKSPGVAGKGYLSGIGIFIILTALIGGLIATNFAFFWEHMHYVLFTNDLWILNPETDILIKMVPEKFFFDMVVRILLTFVASVLLLAGICLVILKYFRKGVVSHD